MAKASRTTNRLIALSSVAVLGIYTTGFLRTRAAAQQLADEENRPRRRDGAPPSAVAAVTPADRAPVASGPTVTLAPKTTPRTAPTASDARAGVASTAASPRPAGAGSPGPTRTASNASVASVGATPGVKAESLAAGAPASLAAAPAGAAATPAATPSPAPTAATPQTSALPETPAAAAVVAAPAAVAPAPAKVVYKDGTYTGWGTSRHGDIQASVTIDGGRIASVTIAQCLTRYSCSWIAALPGQVVARQSPETDYVSGATQSTNALYYAVVEALAKAK